VPSASKVVPITSKVRKAAAIVPRNEEVSGNQRKSGLFLNEHMLNMNPEPTLDAPGGHTMKIAIPTMDGHSISAHFGKSKAFLVFETEGAAVKTRELRDNDQHKPQIAGQDSHSHEAGHHHDHGGFTRLLGDCQAVIVRGMGAGAVQALRSAGIRIYLVEETCSPEAALARFANGQLLAQEGGSCGCHGHQH
jgi:predicted Fe-Mo cluster-binding NifX family protein